MIRRYSLFVGLLALAACNDSFDGTDEPSAQPSSATTATATASADGANATATASAAGARDVKERNELIDFSYSYPEEAGRIPQLAHVLDAMLDDSRDKLMRDARQGRDAARDSGFPFNQYWLHTKWRVVGETPAWLSLAAQFNIYTGGAHGNTGYHTMLWNKAEERRLDVLDVFTSGEALADAIRDPFCEELDKQRAKKREKPVDRESGDEFDECIDPVKNGALTLGSSNGRTFDRIGVLVGPYAAGPYVEGTYEITLPLTAAAVETVREEYRDSFATPRN